MPEDQVKKEQLLLEAVKNYLAQDAKLGLKSHDKAPQVQEDDPGNDHAAWFRWEGIDDAFALKAAGSPFFESLTSAFSSVHSYKFIDNPTFQITLDSELRSQGIPAEDRAKACKFVEEIISEYKGSKKAWDEKDGWNPAIDEINEMTRTADSRKAETS